MKYIKVTLDEEGNPESFEDPFGEEWTIYMNYIDLYSEGRSYVYYSYNSYVVPVSEEFEEGMYKGYELINIYSYDRH